ncbi:MAG: universal stress protein [Lentimicrobiaceae bacterium]|nr:universal stress protein [Lentimicrobiaceae bacterium]
MNLSHTNRFVLVPTDFTPVTKNALNHALVVAKTFDLEIILLHVINRETRSKVGKDNTEAKVEEQLKVLADEVLSRDNLKVICLYREGSIFDMIEAVAREYKPQFMVLGTHGKKGLQYLFGSYALKVISQSPCPVIVVQEKPFPEHGFQRIVFPIGLHTEARQQVLYAVLSHGFFQSEIMVFVQLSREPGEVTKLNVITAQIQEEFRKHGVRHSITKAENTSDFGSQLLHFSVSRNADMIMMMTDSVIDNPGFDNSSWSEKLMFNTAQIPVLCINPVYLGQIHYRL